MRAASSALPRARTRRRSGTARTRRRLPDGRAFLPPPTGRARASSARAAARAPGATPRSAPRAPRPTARVPPLAPAAPRAPAAARRPAPASRLPDELVAGRLHDVAHLPARRRDLVTEPVRLGEVPRITRLVPLLRERRDLGRRLLHLGDRLEAEDPERTPQQILVAPTVLDGERIGRIEVVLVRRFVHGHDLVGLAQLAVGVVGCPL